MELLKGGDGNGMVPKLSNLAVRPLKCDCGSLDFWMTLPVKIHYNALSPMEHSPVIAGQQNFYDCKSCGKQAGFKHEKDQLVKWVFIERDTLDENGRAIIEPENP